MESLRVTYRHAPITTTNTGDAAARRKALQGTSGKVWVQCPGANTVWVKFGTGAVDAGGQDASTGEIEIMAGSAQPVLNVGDATHVSVYGSSDFRCVIMEVAS